MHAEGPQGLSSVALAFTVTASLALGLCALGFVGLGLVRLESRLGVEGDGIAVGGEAPRWALEDSEGLLRFSPPAAGWMMVLFADHSLREFPGVVEGINALRDEPDLTIVMATRANPAAARFFVEAMNLPVALLPVDSRFYRDHKVRVMPFVQIIDASGRVQANGLVNRPETVLRMWEYAQRGPAGNGTALRLDMSARAS